MIGSIGNIAKIPELKRRVIFTLLMLLVYRIGVHIPTPGINTAALKDFFGKYQQTLFGVIDMFTGGALENFSVFSLGIMPYISASIILQLLTVVVPHLERLSKEGEAGRKKITQYTRYGTVVLSLIQGMGISFGLAQTENLVHINKFSFVVLSMITLTAGTAFIMWLGEQITEHGIGNGISLIIFAGIVARMPSALGSTVQLVQTGDMGFLVLLLLLVIMIAVIALIVFVERGQRRIPVQYAKRVVGRRVYGGQSTHLPLKVNTAGVIPPIFASSLIIFPATIAQFTQVAIVTEVTNYLRPGTGVYELLYVVLIVFFCYFYTAVTFNPVDVADNMKKYGGYIPGIRPGKKTAQYIDKVLTRITLGGAIYVSAVCVLPSILIGRFNAPFYFGGTSLLIVVGVALDTLTQIETHMIQRHYEGFIRTGRIKGRR
ncbi:MAG: preprotein translocase subunit SecY [Thermodesulfobacteriota bacterium]|nr:preprotein translocase subunit SecY [Thermodesulfobacteriota bacterium]